MAIVLTCSLCTITAVTMGYLKHVHCKNMLYIYSISFTAKYCFTVFAILLYSRIPEKAMHAGIANFLGVSVCWLRVESVYAVWVIVLSRILLQPNEQMPCIFTNILYEEQVICADTAVLYCKFLSQRATQLPVNFCKFSQECFTGIFSPYVCASYMLNSVYIVCWWKGATLILCALMHYLLGPAGGAFGDRALVCAGFLCDWEPAETRIRAGVIPLHAGSQSRVPQIHKVY